MLLYKGLQSGSGITLIENFGIYFGIWSPTTHIPQNPHFLNIVYLILLELMTWLIAYIEEDLKLPKIVLGVKVASDYTENPPNAEEI